MEESMYAVVGTWTMAPGHWDEQVQGLHEQVVPRVHQVPGFVSAYWMRDWATSKTFSVVILENEEAARRFQAFVESNPLSREQAGVTVETLTTVEVVAEAHR